MGYGVASWHDHAAGRSPESLGDGDHSSSDLAARPGLERSTMWVSIACAQRGQRHLIWVAERLRSASSLALGVEVTERQLARGSGEVTGDVLA